ncbi:membrane protein [Burkholderia thailandensis]|uniref:membrane protein n=1 Tax=Burkholderia thailandensis TaxID=57975 RepID=UPI0003EC7801|nr:membrane protein [Burkholderia thailandensis]AHI63349.1 hypothetical protein BTL_468 [Burkholderia thailandensis H0587]AOJ49538.1 hypothetical protein AQ475_00910 [Burkholderia thailandensis]AVR24911.1 hypothetical protein A8H32_07050 [Burkholderia thailandensis]MCZ2896369.1 hypothetical protein [Burkholderia thailandensis]TGB31178.1 hypothetical protein C6946_24595 [Burkholderia thailandensis]
MRAEIAAGVLAAVIPFVCEAASTVVVDAKRNCLSNTGTVSGGTPATFPLAPGRYVVAISPNNMSCSAGVLTGGCLINSVMLQGRYGNNRWGTTITQPTVVDVPGNTSTYIAYVSDDACGDNTGQATLLIQTAN